MRMVHFLPGIVWLIISSVLLAVPGQDLPSVKFITIPHLDKWVHLVMFAVLTFTFSWPFLKSSLPAPVVHSWIISIALYAIAFGIAMEFVQKYLVRNRSFELVDVGFDALGSIAGVLVSRWLYKKIGPDRNRGRNQN